MKRINTIDRALSRMRYIFLPPQLKRSSVEKYVPFGFFAVAALILAAVVAVLVSEALAFHPDAKFPPRAQQHKWLFGPGVSGGAAGIRPGPGSQKKANDYNTAIELTLGVKRAEFDTFRAWKATYGFDGRNETNAAYYNLGDLGFGREMHCRRNPEKQDAGGTRIPENIACYVVNHGIVPDPGLKGGPGSRPGSPPEKPIDSAISGVIGGEGPNRLAAVAMVYRPDLKKENKSNAVTFYVYPLAPDTSDKLAEQVALDTETEEPKYVPHLCLACHGGTYNADNTVTGANFLPFDTAAFKFSQQSPLTLDDQQEAFRRLNEIVLDTDPALPIQDLINGWYKPNSVRDSNSKLNEDFVADPYNKEKGATKTDEDFYKNVFAPYCRTCHVALREPFSLSTPANAAWGLATNTVFDRFDMPNAEQTNHNFWSSPAPAELARFLATKQNEEDPIQEGPIFVVDLPEDVHDPEPDKCTKGNCSLREAIIAANEKPDKNIITFARDRTFTLSIPGSDENQAARGDLDIRSNVIILGNGAGKTIIDGGEFDDDKSHKLDDRIFHIHSGANLVIQGVTIQGGSCGLCPSNEPGTGGIQNDGGKLTLNSSVVRNNLGIAIANIADQAGGATTEINNSTIGPNNLSILNEGSTLTVNNSTISDNFEGGIINRENGVATITHSTITLNKAIFKGRGIGISNEQSTVNIKNSIVAGNLDADCQNEVGKAYNSRGYNLVGENGDARGCPTNENTDRTDIILPGSIGTAIDTTLQGVVPYHALVEGSPAIDAIPLGDSCLPPSYDQGNVARPLGRNTEEAPSCDIGAAEARFALDVTTAADTVEDDGKCSLREAIAALNTGLPSGQTKFQTFGECHTDPTIREINLAVSGPYNLTMGHLEASSLIRINGNGRAIRRDSGNSRIFLVSSSGNLILSGVTLENGSLTGGEGDLGRSGGGIYISPNGEARIQFSIIRRNSARAGGGIANRGTLSIINSSISDNSAATGGGIDNRGTLSITNSTIGPNNSALEGGGVAHRGKLQVDGVAPHRGKLEMVLATSTITTNLAGRGGGIFVEAKDVAITESTITANRVNTLISGAAAGGGIFGTARVKNTILAGNRTDATGPDCTGGGGILSEGYNLIGDASDCSLNRTTGDKVGTAGSPVNSLLGSLERISHRRNPTHPLLTGSPAIDAGSCPGSNADQRRLPRPVDVVALPNADDGCDIGAYELQSPG